MSASKKEIMQDLAYCRESLDRIIEFAKRELNETSVFFYGKRTVIQSDIIKLRRELNEIRRKLDGDF